jgi:ATP-dependent DNA helicase DinG
MSMLRAHVQQTGGEQRPQQELMLEHVEEAIGDGAALLVQAGTGTGKSLAYAFAVAASGKTAVIATATNQLSEQLAKKDLPQVAELMARQRRPLAVASLKGRSQYLCKAKLSETQGLTNRADSLFTDEDRDETENHSDGRLFARLAEWAGSTETGDRVDAPGVPDRLWAQLSVSSAECARNECPFFGDCFAEKAKAQARKADIIVTNHALLAQEIRLGEELATANEGVTSSLLPDHAVLVVDEAHAFPASLSDALATTLDAQAIHVHLKKARKMVRLEDELHSATLKRCADALDDIDAALGHLSPGPVPALTETLARALEKGLMEMLNLSKILRDMGQEYTREGKSRKGTAATLIANQIDADAVTIARLRSVSPGWVRWVEVHNSTGAYSMSTAPLEVGPIFASALEARTLIATSATLEVAGSFEPLQRQLGVLHARTLDAGTPFDYPKQGMLYIPRSPFPEPVGKERREHTAAVLSELEALVQSAGGRTLALFTTTASAVSAAASLRKQFPSLQILAHGDAPADALVRSFAEDETSVLCATMGLWQGVSVEGAACSLVVIDKISFPPPDDALTQARREHADEMGRNGFEEVFVAKAAIDIAQAAGRLIRTSGDKGVVAILDPRLLTKRYGRTLIASLPNFPLYTDRDTVTDALTRLTGGLDPSTRHRRRSAHRSTSTTKTSTRSSNATRRKAPVTKARRVPRTPKDGGAGADKKR